MDDVEGLCDQDFAMEMTLHVSTYPQNFDKVLYLYKCDFSRPAVENIPI